MLQELTDLQESDERVWGTPNLSFTIRSRVSEGDEIVERTYTFSHAKEWDKWTFDSFKERRTEDTERIQSRAWHVTRNVNWEDPGDIPEDIAVPAEVQDELEGCLDAESISFQHP